MSFARPHVLAGVHPDTVRIVAMSAAIALNAAALIAVMRPMVASLPEAMPLTPVIRLIDHPATPKPVAAPPPVVLKPVPVARHAPATVAKPVAATPPVTLAVPTDEGTTPAMPVGVDTTPAAPQAVTHAPVEATLAYVSAPAPVYPRIAIAARMSGTVTLRVLVDEAGKPVDVVVETSSGHAALDNAARDQVLARWRFQPAQQDGRPVRAWARIPVTFDLRKI